MTQSFRVSEILGQGDLLSVWLYLCVLNIPWQPFYTGGILVVLILIIVFQGNHSKPNFLCAAVRLERSSLLSPLGSRARVQTAIPIR